MVLFSLSNENVLRFTIAIVLIANIYLWFSVRTVQGEWMNVPPPPSLILSSANGLGDTSFSYRINGLMLQNMGDTGGQTTSLKDYNYENLSKWFYLQDHLDNKSDFTPYLAAFYFGGVQEPEKYRPVIDYLEDIGASTYAEKWRWLAQAVYFARFRLNDYDRALELADKLATLPKEGMPGWARQMPAFVVAQSGDKEAAYILLLEILRSSADKLHPNEVNSMVLYICTRLLTSEKAKQDPLCQKNE